MLGLIVFVRHVVMASSEMGLSFAEEFYNVELPEDSAQSTLIKVLTVIGSESAKEKSQSVVCEVFDDSAKAIFKTNLTGEGNCALWLDRPDLDYETLAVYQIKIRLRSLLGHLKIGRNLTMVI